MKQSTLKKFLRLPAFDEHLELHRIDCLSSHGQLDAYEYSREQLRSMPPEAIRPTPLITGRDLIEAGYEPGPRFKEILARSRTRNWKGDSRRARRRWSLCGASFPPSFEGRRRHDLPTSTVSRQLILVLRAATLATHFTNNSQ
jgi:hypothetical protein